MNGAQIQLVTDEKEIKEFQKRFEETLKKIATEKYTALVGWLGGNAEVTVYYLSNLDMWVSFEEGPNRYWNAFGLGKPIPQGPNNIIVEINFPFSGKDRRIGGAFIKKDDKILVCHRGRLGGGREGIGYILFWENYSGEVIEVGEERFAVIGELDSEDLPERIKKFVEEVKRIKNMIKNISETSREEREEEYIEVALSIERDIQNFLAHNPEALEKGLKIIGREYSVKTGRIDILALDSKGNYVVIEIKSGIAGLDALSQIQTYMGALIEEGKKNIRGIIVANDFEEKLVYAVKASKDVSLVKYRVSFSFQKVEK